MIYSIFLIYIGICAAAPINRTAHEQLNVVTTPLPKKARIEESCFFSQLRKTESEYEERPVKSVVSLNCEGKEESLMKYADTVIDQRTGATSALSLLLCRGAGECDLDFSNPATVAQWKDVKICVHHANELLLKWDDAILFKSKHVVKNEGKDSCSMPNEICPKHNGRPTTNLRILTVKESNLILKRLGILVHPGIPICTSHETTVNDLQKIEGAASQGKRKYQNVPETSETCGDPSYHYPGEMVRDEAAVALHKFAEKIGVERVCYPNKPFIKLREDSKRKKVCGVKTIYDAVAQIVAPSYSTELKKMVFEKYEDEEEWSSGSTKELDKVLKQVALHFRSAENRQEKLIILGLVANSVPLSKIQQYLPNLSGYWYAAARKFARRERNNAPVPKLIKENYNEKAVQHFVDFITSPSVMVGLPYGNRKVKTSDGTKVIIPDSIRQLSFSEIFTMYENHRKEGNDDKNDYQLSKSSIFRILDICAATDRKSSTCVDYYIANGLEAFDKLHEILDGWIEENLTADDILKHLKSGLLDALQYLRTDFRLHVKRFSRVADHCATFGLSDPKEKEYSTSYTTGSHAHKHDYKCERCETLNAILTEITKFGNNFQESSQDIVDNDGSDSLDKDKKTLEKRTIEVEMIKRHKHQILEMKKHILRSAFTDQERQNIVNSLSVNEGLLTLDFAQKYLPTWHREKQADYYGKKGISYHVGHIAANVSAKYVQHTFVHIYQQEVSQDSKLVVQTISHILSELKKIGIKAVTLRSDNAGCYHSAPTIHSLHSLMEITGVTIKAYSFSEVQNGKGASDRGASQVKYKAERYIVQGHDITTSQQFFDAMKFEPILNGFSFHHGTIATEETDVPKWKGISDLNHFIVEAGGIRAFRYGGIGEGSFLQKTDLKPLKGSYVFESSGFLPTLTTEEQEKKSVLQGEITKFWYYSSCVKSKSCGPEPDTADPEIDDQLSNDAEIGNMYACPEPGCSATFLKSSNLDYHILKDQHKKSPEKVTMRDYALKLFSNFLENVQTEHTAEFVSNAINQFQESTIPTNLAEGHSLPEKKANKPFGTKVTAWLKNLFDEGWKKKAKAYDAATVAQRMMTETNADGSLMFSGEELKTTSQISGYFKREAEKQRNKSVAKREAPTESTKNIEELDYTPDEEEHPDAGLAHWIKDEAFVTIADKFVEAIRSDSYFVHSVKKTVTKA